METFAYSQTCKGNLPSPKFKYFSSDIQTDVRHAAEHPHSFIGGPSEWGQSDKSCLKAPPTPCTDLVTDPKGWGTRVFREADFERSPWRLGRDNRFSGWPPQAQPRLNMRTRVRCLQLTKQWFTTGIQPVTCTAIRKDMETQKKQSNFENFKLQTSNFKNFRTPKPGRHQILA